MKIILLSVLLSSTSIFSQITITNNDFADMFTVGNEITIRENDTGGGVNIGNPGGGNNWDFSWFQGNLQVDLLCIDPASSPYINEFPDANIATYGVGDFEGEQAELWNYSSLNGTFGNHGTAIIFSSQPADLFTIKHKPARIEAELPLTINSSWSQSYTQTLYFNGNPILTSQISYSVVVDAYGTMTLPGQVSFEALRMRQTITVDGIITGVNYQFLSKSGAQVSVFASDPNPPNSGVIIVDGYSWNFEFSSSNINLAVTYPGSSDLLIAGELDSIEYINWKDDINLYYSTDNGQNFEIIDSNYNSPVGTYYWDVPESLLTTRAIISVVDSKDSASSGTFKIKPWQLSRLDENDDFELYIPDQDGWSFSNSRANIWPQTWWQQFDYQSGIDPYTSFAYPPIPPFLRAADSLFPDWPLFVDVYSFPKCYFQTIVPVYRPKALRNWKAKSGRWGGSCFGFAVSSLLGFYHKQELVQFIGDFTDLFLEPLDDQTRYPMNYFQITQYSEEIRNYRRINTSKTPRGLLNDLKEMLREEDRDGRPLRYPNTNGSGGHAVVPYKLERDSLNTSAFFIWVYNPNRPGNLNQFIYLDSLANTWSDSTSLNFGTGTSDCYLHYKSAFFLNTPSFRPSELKSIPAAENYLSGLSRVLIYNTPNAEIAITSSGGEIGYQDSLAYNNLPDAVPIIPETGYFHPPIGYDLPMDNYSIQINNFTTPDSYIMFETDSTIYDYRRIDADNNETDLLNYSENGIKIINPDQAEKNIELETIIIEDTTSEKLFIVSNLNLSEGDSLQIKEEGRSDLVLSNYGSGKNYDLHIRLASTNGEMLFEHNAISIDKNTGHQLVPVWNDLQNEPVKILIDIGNDGTIDDSIFVKNQATNVKDYITGPLDFQLYQNYPNPFNPTTTIAWRMPVEGHVRLVIFDILGREIKTLVNKEYKPGMYEIEFNGSDLPSGVYIYKLTTDNYSASRKMLIIK